MRLFLSVALLSAAVGCRTMAPRMGTPVVSCDDAPFATVEALAASGVEQIPEPVGGIEAIERRIRVRPERGPLRPADPADRYAVVTALIDTSGTVRCSDVLSAESPQKGQAAREAVHASAFVPGRHAGQTVAVLLNLRLDVRGEGVRRVVRGDQIGQ